MIAIITSSTTTDIIIMIIRCSGSSGAFPIYVHTVLYLYYVAMYIHVYMWLAISYHTLVDQTMVLI